MIERIQEGRDDGIFAAAHPLGLTAEFDPDSGTVRLVREGGLKDAGREKGEPTNGREKLSPDGRRHRLLVYQFAHWFPLTSSS